MINIFKSRRFFQPNIVNLIYEGQMFQNYVDLYSNNVNIWPNKQLTDKIQVAKKISCHTLSRRPLWSYMAGWSYVIHGRLEFHPSMSSGSSLIAALCIRARLMHAHSFSLGIDDFGARLA